MRKPGNKAKFIDCLPELPDSEDSSQNIRYSLPPVDGIVIDGPALVQSTQPRRSKTFGEYCTHEIGSRVKQMAQNFKRLHLCFDVYEKGYRKRETRQDRGKGKKKGVRVSVQKDTPLYSTFSKILYVDENKTELNSLIAETTVEICSDMDTTVVVTNGEKVLSNKPIARENIEPCNKEEADDRMFLHAMDMSSQGYKKLCIVSSDSDVVVIALYAYWYLDLDELWVEFGVGTERKWLPIHTYASILGEPICHALPFWYAFTGCDTVSQFASCAKKTAWNTWAIIPEVTKTFSSLPFSDTPSENDMRIIEQFVVLMYSRTSPVFTVNECRKYLFTKMNKAIEDCPPTLDALKEQCYRV